jgi:hypothetical protein
MTRLAAWNLLPSDSPALIGGDMFVDSYQNTPTESFATCSRSGYQWAGVPPTGLKGMEITFTGKAVHTKNLVELWDSYDLELLSIPGPLGSAANYNAGGQVLCSATINSGAFSTVVSVSMPMAVPQYFLLRFKSDESDYPYPNETYPPATFAFKSAYGNSGPGYGAQVLITVQLLSSTTPSPSTPNYTSIHI